MAKAQPVMVDAGNRQFPETDHLAAPFSTARRHWRYMFDGDLITANTTDQPAQSTIAEITTGTPQDLHSATNGRAIFDPGDGNSFIGSFFGTDAANETFDCECWEWRFIEEGALYIPMHLFDLTATLGTAVKANVTLGFWADTIALTTADNDMTPGPLNLELLQPGTANNHAVRFKFDYLGANFLEFKFDRLTGAGAGGVFTTV